jgi:putative membrane protein
VAGILDVINMCAIDTAKLALSKSQNEDVRAYAQKMLDYHSKLEKELTDALGEARIVSADSDISTMLKAHEQKVLDALGASQQFDRDFATHEVISHAMAFGLLHAVAGRHLAEHGDETEGADAFATLVTKTIGKFARHERKALELQSKVSGLACGPTPLPSETTTLRRLPPTH